MDTIVIEGGAALRGVVPVSGAKNAALPVFAATLLAPGRYRIENVPDLRDIRTIAALLIELGAAARLAAPGVWEVDTSRANHFEAPYDLVKTMRASCLVLGPLTARLGRARVSLPGGCAIGERPIDQHLKGLEALGASIGIEHGYVEAARPRRLKGARVLMDIITVTGAMNVMMAATLAEGRTVIENAAREPEVAALADFLNAMGARVTGAGTPEIVIEGVDALRPANTRIIPDRIEAGTYMTAAAITGGEVTVEGIDPALVANITGKLHEIGCVIKEGAHGVTVGAPEVIRSVNVNTAPYPGFPTDMQAQIMALLAVGDGASVITETIFENRFMHVAELRRMGADIHVHGATATVRGVASLSGAPLMATDLRASASLVLAGLAAEGRTTISRVYHLDRGYERLEEKLRALGARIWRAPGQ